MTAVYTLVSLESHEAFSCDGEFWGMMLDKARQAGWCPLGTHYDLEVMIDENCDWVEDRMYKLYALLMTWHDSLAWDGNYTDRENQIITEEDAWYMKCSLEKVHPQDAFMRFLEKGSFRILSW